MIFVVRLLNKMTASIQYMSYIMYFCLFLDLGLLRYVYFSLCKLVIFITSSKIEFLLDEASMFV